MKVATWNINECVGITCNLDNQKSVEAINIQNVEEIIKKVNEYDFDVICFQEYPTYINKNESLTNELLSKTKLKYCETYDTYDSYLFKGGRIGVAIFSKYEIKDIFKTLFKNPNYVKQSSSGRVYYTFDKGIIKAVIKVADEEFTIITGHAMAFAPFDKTEFDYPESYKPLEELIKKSNNGNLIVLGDFNTEKLFDIIPEIKNDVTDIVNSSTTKDYYENRGQVQMDYILINDKMKSTTNYKIDNFSDHYIIGANILKK